MPSDAAVMERARTLTDKSPKDERLDALKWLTVYARAKNATLAVPALERCIRTDPEPSLRKWAVDVLATIAKTQSAPCPLALVEAMFDKDEEVRTIASAWLTMFKTYADGSVAVLMRGAESDNELQRGSCLLFLAQIDGKNKQVLAVIEKRKNDKHFSVRHDAHIAEFRATDDLERFVIYHIRLLHDPDGALPKIDKDTEVGKQEITYRNLARVGGAMQKIDWSESRPDQYAQVLLKVLKNSSPLLRRGAVRDIGVTTRKVKLEPLNLRDLLPDEQKVEPDPLAEKSKVAIVLAKMKADQRLRELRDNDPDENVRAAARVALERWERVFGKKVD
jgi:hypothetical protein